MISRDLQTALGEFKESVQRAFGPRLERVVLFGSFARGLVHEESDVDLLVLLAFRQPGDGALAVQAAVEVMLRRPEWVLSPLVMTVDELRELRARERRLAQDIDREGVPL